MANARAFFFLLLFFLVFSCGEDQSGRPVTAANSAAQPVIEDLFELQDPNLTGVTFENQIENTLAMNCFNFPYLYIGGGVAVLDFDKDGRQDLFFVSNQEDNKLYRNEGDWKFTDVTDQAGVAAPEGHTSGVAVVDVNADGYPDLYLTRRGAHV